MIGSRGVCWSLGALHGRLGGLNVCDKCECAEVQDAIHALFYCNCFEVCELRRKYKDLLIDPFKPLHAFAWLPHTDCIPFLASFHKVSPAADQPRVSSCRPSPFYEFGIVLLAIHLTYKYHAHPPDDLDLSWDQIKSLKHDPSYSKWPKTVKLTELDNSPQKTGVFKMLPA
eukprot:1150069-Pelagomonas_calceolata.AAC.1